MSLRHALLGLLAEKPASGWDLSRRFDRLLGSVWPAGHPQIYGELRKLQVDGLIEIDGEGPRGRKDYRITDAGAKEVRHWLADVEVDHTLRLEPLLRSVFFWLLEPAELIEHLDREAAYYHALAEGYRTMVMSRDDDLDPQTESLRIAAEAGIRLTSALGQWADWAKAHPPRVSH
ncbi:PadR family transcriptional regulator [Nocardia stercoris]|uniref:PadR family transcriptional regulator n=1 Tax=Nocardia stercoris TaxID=2483361 RepID=A0A3M2L375_9NOCA|nr:PadR family transcriptional regulator [Nocardia stercoris]RMI32169.1 PadR family transcriptional regulator [Nocardia stercoris]